MDKVKLTIAEALRCFATNAINNEFYIRIGWYLLDSLDVGLDSMSNKQNKFAVQNMRSGKRYEYNDLFAAIVKFVDLVNAD